MKLVIILVMAVIYILALFYVLMGALGFGLRAAAIFMLKRASAP